jgi:O-antigen/teichoic acid export membrane protein
MKLTWDKSTLSFLRSSVLSAAASLFVGLGGYLIRRILANTLSVDDFARFYFLMAAATMLVVFFRLGTADLLLFGMSGMERPQKNPGAWNLFSGICRFNLYVFFALSVICAAPALFSSQRTTLFLLIPFFLLFSFETLFNNALNALKLFREQYGLQCLKTLLMVILVCICSSRWGVSGTIAAFNLPMLFTGLLAFIWLKRVSAGTCFRKPDRKLLVPLRQNCLWLFLLSFSPVIFNELGTVMLTLFSTNVETAVFNIALPVAMIIRSFYCVVTVLIPFVGEMKCCNDYEKIRKYLHGGAGVVLLAAVALIPFFLFFGRWLLVLLFGGQFRNAVFPAFLLSEAMLIAFLGQMNINILNTLDQEKISAVLTLQTALFSVVTYAVSAKLGGADWTAAACLLSALLWSVLSYSALIRYLRKQ